MVSSTTTAPYVIPGISFFRRTTTSETLWACGTCGFVGEANRCPMIGWEGVWFLSCPVCFKRQTDGKIVKGIIPITPEEVVETTPQRPLRKSPHCTVGTCHVPTAAFVCTKCGERCCVSHQKILNNRLICLNCVPPEDCGVHEDCGRKVLGACEGCQRLMCNLHQDAEMPNLCIKCTASLY